MVWAAMTLDDLRALVTAYRAKSMSEAARQLGCTQGAIAQHVRKLELELGTDLFVRLRRGVAPTGSGTTLYEAADQALRLLEQAVAQIERDRQTLHNRLRLSIAPNILERVLRRYIVMFQARRPQVEVELDLSVTAEARIDAVRSGRADLTMVPTSGPLKGLEQRPYRDIELMLLVHAAHPLSRRRRIALRELEGIRHIAQAHNSGTHQHVARAMQAQGLCLPPVDATSDNSTANMLVELGHGETFVPASLARALERTHRVKAVRVPELPPLPMVWAMRNLDRLPPAAAEFMQLCDEGAPAQQG